MYFIAIALLNPHYQPSCIIILTLQLRNGDIMQLFHSQAASKSGGAGMKATPVWL